MTKAEWVAQGIKNAIVFDAVEDFIIEGKTFAERGFHSDSFSPQANKRITTLAMDFLLRCKFENVDLETDRDLTNAGIDLWLTTTGAGVGFWDGDWGNRSEALMRVAENYGHLEHWDFFTSIHNEIEIDGEYIPQPKE